MADQVDRILEKLAQEVEYAVHALYPGEVRKATGSANTARLLRSARGALDEAIGTVARTLGEDRPASPAASTPWVPSPRPSAAPPTIAGEAYGWSQEDSDAVLKCINAWLPVAGPQSTEPDTLCIAPGRMLIPTWGERERAREAVRKISR